jgi:hypothetical protein
MSYSELGAMAWFARVFPDGILPVAVWDLVRWIAFFFVSLFHDAERAISTTESTPNPN